MSSATAASPRRRSVARRLRDLDFWLSVGTVLSVLYLAVFVVKTTALGVAYAANFEGYAANGALQIYNPLRRMAEGQLPGRDFPFFHGVGVPWAHYPLFEVLGGNVFAAEVSRQLLSPFLFLVTSAVFFAMFFRTWRKTLIATASFTIFSLAFNDVINAGNSLIGVRSAFPILVAAILLWRPRHRWRVGQFALDARILLALLGLGVGVSFGTEQAIAAIGAYVVVRFVVLIRQARWWVVAVQLLAEGVLLLAVALGTLSLLTGGHAVEALRYALVDIPQDQGWYFGAPPNRYLSVSAIVELATADQVPYMIFTIIAAIAVVRVAQRLGRTHPHELRTYLYLLVYGLLACVSFLGYFWPAAQMVPLARSAGLIFVAVAIDLLLNRKLWTAVRQRVDGVGRAVRDLGVVTLVVALSGLGFGLFVQIKDLRELPLTELPSRVAAVAGLPDSEAAGAGWRERVATFDELIPADATVWSTYASLYESSRGTFQPSEGGEDYIIHALGERRERYTQDFIDQRPDFAITLKPSYFVYEEWLWGGNSEFYAALFQDYRVVAENSAHYLWERRTDEVAQPDEWREAARAADGVFEIPTDGTAALYEVRVRYDASGGLPFADRVPRYLLTATGSGLTYGVSVPAGHDAEAILLMPVMSGQPQARIVANAVGIVPTASFDVTAIEYRRLPVPDENLVVFVDNYCSRAPVADAVYAEACLTARVTPPDGDPPHSP